MLATLDVDIGSLGQQELHHMRKALLCCMIQS